MAVDLQIIPGKPGVRWEYTMDVMAGIGTIYRSKSLFFGDAGETHMYADRNLSSGSRQ